MQATFAASGDKALHEQASDNGSFSNILMNGSEVFKFAVRAVPKVPPALAMLRLSQLLMSRSCAFGMCYQGATCRTELEGLFLLCYILCLTTQVSMSAALGSRVFRCLVCHCCDVSCSL